MEKESKDVSMAEIDVASLKYDYAVGKLEIILMDGLHGYQIVT